jgi:hypothetical protein
MEQRAPKLVTIYNGRLQPKVSVINITLFEGAVKKRAFSTFSLFGTSNSECSNVFTGRNPT